MQNYKFYLNYKLNFLFLTLFNIISCTIYIQINNKKVPHENKNKNETSYDGKHSKKQSERRE